MLEAYFERGFVEFKLNSFSWPSFWGEGVKFNWQADHTAIAVTRILTHYKYLGKWTPEAVTQRTKLMMFKQLYIYFLCRVVNQTLVIRNIFWRLPMVGVAERQTRWKAFAGLLAVTLSMNRVAWLGLILVASTYLWKTHSVLLIHRGVLIQAQNFFAAQNTDILTVQVGSPWSLLWRSARNLQIGMLFVLWDNTNKCQWQLTSSAWTSATQFSQETTIP